MSGREDSDAVLDLVELVQGQVHALTAFALALAAAHPQRVTLRREFARAREAAIARTVAQPVSDNFFDGMNEVLELLTRQLQRAEKGSEPPHKP